MDFSDGQNSNMNFSEGTTFKLLKYEGVGTPSLSDLASADDQGRALGTDCYLDIPTNASGSGEDTAYVFTAAAKGGLTAKVQIKNMIGNVAAPDPAITGYYIRVKIQEKTGEVDEDGNPEWQDVGWTLIPAGTISEGETSYTVDKYVSLQKNPLSSNLGDNDWTYIDLSKNRVNLSDKYAVRMITIQNPDWISKYDDAIADEPHANNITDDAPEGYEWKGISADPEGTEKTGLSSGKRGSEGASEDRGKAFPQGLFLDADRKCDAVHGRSLGSIVLHIAFSSVRITLLQLRTMKIK